MYSLLNMGFKVQGLTLRVSQFRGTSLGSLKNKDCNILGVYIGSPIFGKLPVVTMWSERFMMGFFGPFTGVERDMRGCGIRVQGCLFVGYLQLQVQWKVPSRRWFEKPPSYKALKGLGACQKSFCQGFLRSRITERK